MIVPVVEGQGEEQSVRIVLQRMMADFERYVEIDRPFRVKRDKIVQPSELERCIDRIFSGRENVSAVLLLLDADDDCPKDRGAELRARGQTHIGNRGYFGVVLANREFEAWFLADLEGLSAEIDGAPFVAPPQDAEAVRGAKEMLRAALRRPYRPTVDQAAFASRFDLRRAAERCRSFRKLQAELARILRFAGAAPPDILR